MALGTAMSASRGKAVPSLNQRVWPRKALGFRFHIATDSNLNIVGFI
jgi:hypothetical protein